MNGEITPFLSFNLLSANFFLLKTIYNYEEKVNNGIGNKKHQRII
jgi:hypothetical protein